MFIDSELSKVKTCADKAKTNGKIAVVVRAFAGFAV